MSTSTAVPRKSGRLSQRGVSKAALTIPSTDSISTISYSSSSSSSLKSENDTVESEVDSHSISSISDYTTTSPDTETKENIPVKPEHHEFLTAHSMFGDYVRKHEIPRKVFHSSIGFITLYLYTIGVQADIFPRLLHISFLSIFSIDILRFKSRRLNKLYCKLLGALMRDSEVDSYNGVLWYLLGLDFSFSIFPKDVILLSVLLLSWSDTAASTFGRRFGYLTPKLAKNKSLAGSMAAFAVGIISSYLLYAYFIPEYSQFNRVGDIYWTPDSSYLNLHTMSILAGFVAALSEGIDIFNWDDNFTIPVLSSIFFYCVITAFHK